MRTKKVIAALMVATLVLGSLAFAGCSKLGGSGSDITGEWEIEGATSTYVITKTAITFTGGEIPYKLEEDNVILLFPGEDNEVKATYELSEDGKTLTIIETPDMGDTTGTPQEIKTVFTRISDNADATPAQKDKNDTGTTDESESK